MQLDIEVSPPAFGGNLLKRSRTVSYGKGSNETNSKMFCQFWMDRQKVTCVSPRCNLQ